MLNLLRHIPSELQHHKGSSLKGTRGLWEGTKGSGIRARAGGQLFPRQKGGQGPLCLFCALPQQSHRTGRQESYLRLLQPGLHCLPCPGIYLRFHPTQFTSLPPALLSLAKQPQAWHQQQPVLAHIWLLLGTSKSSTSSSHLQIAL